MAVEVNVDPELEELRASANRGVVPAQIILGVLLLEGSDEVPRDYEEAFGLLSKAAARGAARARYNLARMYLHGLGTAPDPARAAELFEQAAQQGEFLACIELGRLFAATDRGDDARSWYQLAVAQADRVDAPQELAEAQGYLDRESSEE